MLPGELRTRAEHEVALLPAQAPDDLPGAAADLVDRGRVPGGDEDVAVAVEVGRVDVEVVVRILARALVLGNGEVGLGRRHLGKAVPFEEHTAGGDGELLDDALQHEAVARASELTEVGGHLAVDREQRFAARKQLELVDVAGEPVPGADDLQQPVGAIQDVIAARETDAAHAHGALPPGQHRLSLVALHLEVGDTRRRQGLEPDDLALVVDDHRPRLHCLPLGREEHVAPGRALRGTHDGHGRRLQVGATLEVLHGRRWRRGRRGSAGPARVEAEPDAKRDEDGHTCPHDPRTRPPAHRAHIFTKARSVGVHTPP